MREVPDQVHRLVVVEVVVEAEVEVEEVEVEEVVVEEVVVEVVVMETLEQQVSFARVEGEVGVAPKLFGGYSLIMMPSFFQTIERTLHERVFSIRLQCR